MEQLKMMFEGKDQYTLQILVVNDTFIPEAQKMPSTILDVIQITMEEEEYFGIIGMIF